MRTILRVSIENFLSFRKETADLSSLNVLVGPNGSGKTNFLRVFQFLGDVARLDLLPAIDLFQGFDQIKYRGQTSQTRVRIGLEGVVTENASTNAPDEYRLSFYERKMEGTKPRRAVSRTETILLKRTKGRGRRITLQGGKMTFAPIRAEGAANQKDDRRVSVQAASSGLSTVRKLGEEYGASQVDALATVFEELRLFEVDVDKARLPGSANEPSRLEADASNIASYLHWMSEKHQPIFRKLCDDVSFVLPSFEAFRFTKLGGSQEAIRVDIKERHLAEFTPMGRASFGTIRAIALFAMLHDPDPPKLTCLEEIDHGLHPHALDRLVERLRSASNNTQLIVATHSPALVNRLKPDELIIFEKDAETGATRIVDLSPAQISRMKQVSGYQLGELWFSGSLGGVL